MGTSFVWCIFSKLFPTAPNESSVFPSSGLADELREGDLGRVEPVKRPLNAETDLCVPAWERTDNGDDLDNVSGTTTGWVIWERKPLNSGNVARLGIGDDIIPCARMVNMTSISPLGSFPSRVWANTPRPARIDLRRSKNQFGAN